MFSAEEILLPLQRLQLTHDEVAHRDILSFSLHTRLKHMVLHFYKYAGKIEEARAKRDHDSLRATLVDTFVICMASANALNVSLGEHIAAESETRDLDGLARTLSRQFAAQDVYLEAVRQLVVIGGKMAKAVESLDHMERGDCRVAMETLVPQLATMVLGLLGRTAQGVEGELRARLERVEQKSIFRRLPSADASA